MPPPKKKQPETRWNPSWDPKPPMKVDTVSQFKECPAGLHWIAKHNDKCIGCDLGAPANLDSHVLSEPRAVPQRAVPKGRPIEDLPEL